MQDIECMGISGERRVRGQNQQALKCPRCDSVNTKFCYYNNYNLSQPRHFCKSCRRYWTRGGVLRNVPVGGGCRKAKRSSKPNNKSISSDTTDTVPVPVPVPPPIAPPPLLDQASDCGIFSNDPLLYKMMDDANNLTDGGFGPLQLDWATGPDHDQALFDLPNTYWQWNHHLP